VNARGGWIRIHRTLRESWLWHAARHKPASHAEAWLDLIMSAAYESGPVLERGELRASARQLARRWRWSPSAARRFLDTLRDDDMITIRRHGRASKIHLTNYACYQADPDTAQPPPAYPELEALCIRCIGVVPPARLAHAVKTYGHEWVAAALSEAARAPERSTKRSWRYVAGVLRGFKDRGGPAAKGTPCPNRTTHQIVIE